MSFIYFLATSSQMFKDKLSFYTTYFEKDGHFLSLFIGAIVVALIFAIVYYLICRMSFSFSRVLTWVVTLFIAGAASFCYTGVSFGLGNNHGTMPIALEKQFKKKATGLTEEQKAPLVAEKNKIRKELNKGFFAANPVNRVCWTNFVLTMIFFYIFSILFNGFSVHGDYVPHAGLFTKKK